MKRFAGCAVTALMLAALFIAPATRALEPAEILSTTTQKMGTYKTWEADYAQNMNMMGSVMKIKGHMTYRMPKEMHVIMDLPMMGQTGIVTVVMGTDGIMWQDMELAGQHRVTKIDTAKMKKEGPDGSANDPVKQMDPRQQLEQMKTNFDFKTLAAVELHEQTMHVLEGTWKKELPHDQQTRMMVEMFDRLRLYIGQQDGFVHKTEMYVKDGDEVGMTQEFTNLKFNQPVAEILFQYTPPEGVDVIDMTDSANRMEAPQPPAPPPAPEPRGLTNQPPAAPRPDKPTQ